MVEKIVGSSEVLLSPDEAELFDRQVAAQKSGDVGKADAEYQNEPHGNESCAGCTMFVPGFSGSLGGYCQKVRSFGGPLGQIFPDGWCKFFEADDVTDTDLADIEKLFASGD